MEPEREKKSTSHRDADFRVSKTGGRLLLVQTELLVEAADTTTGVHHLLLAGEEGVTLGANFDADILLGGASLDHVTAGAPDGGLSVIGMDTFLHLCFTSFTFGGQIGAANLHAS